MMVLMLFEDEVIAASQLLVSDVFPHMPAFELPGTLKTVPEDCRLVCSLRFAKKKTVHFLPRVP